MSANPASVIPSVPRDFEPASLPVVGDIRPFHYPEPELGIEHQRKNPAAWCWSLACRFPSFIFYGKLYDQLEKDIANCFVRAFCRHQGRERSRRNRFALPG